jgi:hypothetical protein
MSSDATSTSSEVPQSGRSHRFWWIVLAIVTVVALLGAAGGWLAFGRSTGVQSIPLPPDPPTPKTVKYDRKQMSNLHGLIRHFVNTAVAHKNLAESYGLIGPSLREDLTLKQWSRGQTTVVPYPVDAKTKIGFDKPESSYAKSVHLQVQIVTPDRPQEVAKAGPQDFFVDLIKVKVDGKWRWLVDNWVPRWTPPIPNSNG